MYIANMSRYLLFLLAAFIVISCNSNPYTITMQDGVTIQYVSTPKYYSTEDDFVHDVAFDFPHPYNYAMPQHIDYVQDSIYTIHGYNQTFIGHWERAKFGDWIKAYGLVPEQNYYVATKVYAKYISMPQDELSIYPKLRTPITHKPLYVGVEHNKEKQACALFAGVRYIGYDTKGKGIYMEIPFFANKGDDQLTWKISVENDIWD